MRAAITRRSALLALMTAPALAACAQSDPGDSEGSVAAESEDGSPASAASESSPAAEPEHLRDNDAVYADQDDTSVVTMYLTVSTGTAEDGTDHTWAEINTYSVYDYDEMGVDRYQVEGLLQVGDEDGPVEGELGYGATEPNATVTIRGQSSSENALKNYKVKIDKGAGTWNDQRVINLNKHMGDGLRFRNKLGFDMLRRIEQLTSLRTQFVHLYVCDTTEGGSGQFEDYGLYTQVEQLNETALAAHGLDENGWLYKVNVFEFYRYADIIKLASDPDYDKDAFEEYLEIKGNDDHSKLIAMLDDLNDESAAIEDVIARHFDQENLAYWMAFSLLVGDVDTENRNFFLYSPTDADTWYILCWDLDGILYYDESQIMGNSRYESWQRGVSNYWGNVLFRRCLQSESFRDSLQAAIDDIRANDLTQDAVTGLVSAYRAVVKPYVYADPTKYCPLDEAEYDTVADGLPALPDFYYESYQESLAKPMPFFIGTPAISDGQMTFNWAASYDFDGEDLTYTATVGTDPQMADVVCEYTGPELSAAADAPDAGQYYLKVAVTNASGESQDAFDIVRLDEGKFFGEIAFTVADDGSVARD